MKLKKDKCLLRCTSNPFHGEVISQQGLSPDQKESPNTYRDATTKIKKELQSFLDTVNCLRRFSPATEEVCKPLQHLILVKADQTWKDRYQDHMTKQRIYSKRCLFEIL